MTYVLHDFSETIGRGSYGTVYREGKHAIKLFLSHDHGEIERISNSVLHGIKAPSALFVLAEWLQIISYKGTICPGLKMECMHSNAHHESTKPRFHGLSYIYHVFDPVLKCVIGAVRFLADNGYAHGDIKLSNVLIKFNSAGISSVKLSDYSFLSKIGTRHQCYPLTQFCMYRHFNQFVFSESCNVYTTSLKHEHWSIAMCIVDLAKQGIQCSCKCTDNKEDFILHKTTALNFQNIEFKQMHIINVIDEFSTRQKQAISNESEILRIQEICNSYKNDALRLCID